MREVDPRSKFSRRFVLKAAATAAPAVAVAGAAGLGISDAWAEGGALQPSTMKTLVVVARDIYPHDFLADIYYVNAVTPWNDKAAGDASVKVLIEDGVGRLDADAHDRFKLPYAQVPWEDQRLTLLRRIEESDFFKRLRSDLVVSLYNQHDLWAKFGYEGSSADKGGYIHRGFNDIDWLPKA